MPEVRPIQFFSPDEARACMAELGVSPAGCGLMAEKCVSGHVLIRDVNCGEANILKQEMLILGGDAAIHKDVITGRIERSDVLLIGTHRQIRNLAGSLREQSFGLPALGEALESALPSARGRLWRFRGRELSLASPARLMGIINATPDSFSDGGQYEDSAAAAAHARTLADDGADILDIGGESSRPGADAVEEDEELRRILPIIEDLQAGDRPAISVDTRRPTIARRALEAGAMIVNDITGFQDPEMIAAAAEYEAGAVIMHMQGHPGIMQADPVYDNVVDDIMAFLAGRARAAVDGGIAPEAIVLDPGIGFGKTARHNMQILRHLAAFRSLGFPLLIGASRKSFIGKAMGLEVGDRLPADLAVTAFCALQKVELLRVHDVRACVAARDMTALLAAGEERL